MWVGPNAANLSGLRSRGGHGLPGEEVLQLNREPLSFVLVFDGVAELSQGAVYHLQTRTQAENRQSSVDSQRQTICLCSHLYDVNGKWAEEITVNEFRGLPAQPALLFLLQSCAQPQLHLLLEEDKTFIGHKNSKKELQVDTFTSLWLRYCSSRRFKLSCCSREPRQAVFMWSSRSSCFSTSLNNHKKHRIIKPEK